MAQSKTWRVYDEVYVIREKKKKSQTMIDSMKIVWVNVPRDRYIYL